MTNNRLVSTILTIMLLTMSVFATQRNVVPMGNLDAWAQGYYSHDQLKSLGLQDYVVKGLLVHTANKEASEKGFGLVDIQKAVDFAKGSNAAQLIRQNSLESGDLVTYEYTPLGHEPVVVTVAWINGATPHDLDLRVFAGEHNYLPFTVDNNGTRSFGSVNSAATAEQVVIDAPRNENISIQVSYNNEINGSQDFVVLVSGAKLSKRAEAAAALISELEVKAQAREARVQAYLAKHGVPRVVKDEKTNKTEAIYDIENGKPVYVTTHNLIAAHSTSTSKVWPGGEALINVSGKTLPRLGVWDAGKALMTHQELKGKVTTDEHDTVPHDDHATHVTTTVVGKGVNPNAKGMAYDAKVYSMDWFDDDIEMAKKAADGKLLVSQHSYGWRGAYDYRNTWDKVANANPYYLISKSAGNDGNTLYKVSRFGNSKNILTVGAAEDMPNGFDPNIVKLTTFSSFGPSPDGRIKPDIVGNGAGVFSAIDLHDSSYASYSGTSMSGPNVAGSVALLQEYYAKQNKKRYMRSATLKALVLHTADEFGPYQGPTYGYGFGFLNTARAAQLIKDDEGGDNKLINEKKLEDGKSKNYKYKPIPGAPITATIVWNDPAPADEDTVDASTPKLINDLDLRIEFTIQDTAGNDTTISMMPWTLDPRAPFNPALPGDNVLDNVEKVFMPPLPPTVQEISVRIRHKGELKDGEQEFSLIMSGVQLAPTVSLDAPNGGEIWEKDSKFNIHWSSTVGHKMTLKLYKDGTKVDDIAKDLPPVGAYSWRIPDDIKLGKDYTIKVESQEDKDLNDKSDDEFEISAQSTLKMVSPKAGDVFMKKDKVDITWDANFDEKVTIYLLINDQYYLTIKDDAKDNKYEWTIPTNIPAGDDYKIKIVHNEKPYINNMTDGDFTVKNPVVKELPLTENFSTIPLGSRLDNFWEQGTDDDIDWAVHKGLVPSAAGAGHPDSTTGPAGDHTEDSLRHYIYVESSTPNNPRKKASLYSPVLDFSDFEKPALEFYYHMWSFNGTMGELSVDIKVDGLWKNNIFSVSGSQGQKWQKTSIDLEPYEGKVVQLRINGITGTSWQSDICVDDIKITGKTDIGSNQTVTADRLMATPNPVSIKYGGVVNIKFNAEVALGNAKLTIFDALGNKVFKTTTAITKKGTNNIASWNLTNRNGRTTAGGTYIAVLEVKMSNGQTKLFKTAIGSK